MLEPPLFFSWCCGLPDRVDCYCVWWGGWRNTDGTNVRDTEDGDERCCAGFHDVLESGGDGHGDGEGDLQRREECSHYAHMGI